VRGTGPDREAITALAADRGFRYVPFGFTPSADDLGEIAALVDSGTLRVRVDRTLRLAEAARAHELGESGQVRGKLVLLTG
jgi:NADPH:quinone reductase-like Zn-dependent oxidoreductase